MGAIKNKLIELMSEGVSNQLTVIADFGRYGSDEYEYTNFKEALAKIEELRLADTNFECSFYIKALHLRTMRERYIKRTADGKFFFWNIHK